LSETACKFEPQRTQRAQRRTLYVLDGKGDVCDVLAVLAVLAVQNNGKPTRHSNNQGFLDENIR
jgi:hypothetical protein